MKTALEYFIEQLDCLNIERKKNLIDAETFFKHKKILTQQAKEMEKEQLFLASKTSAKEAYEAGQQSMYCGCYDISGCTSYKEWLYKQFKSE